MLKNEAEVVAHIRDWLKNYCKSSRMSGFVVGVSGGVDSAVTSTLCAQTGCDVWALNLPIYQKKSQESLATRHIEWLQATFPNVIGLKLDLTAPFKALEKTLPGDIQDNLSMANTRSRLRMLTLFAFANHHRLLVAGTGNKVEDFGVGFFTKYGDGGVDLSPIADLLKSEVIAIATSLGIAKAIIEAPPTDGLWDDGRTDEMQIGASYAEIEWAMEEVNRAGDNINAVISRLTPREKEVLSIYQKFHRTNQHKMMPIPICNIPGDLRKKK